MRNDSCKGKMQRHVDGLEGIRGATLGRRRHSDLSLMVSCREAVILKWEEYRHRMAMPSRPHHTDHVRLGDSRGGNGSVLHLE